MMDGSWSLCNDGPRQTPERDERPPTAESKWFEVETPGKPKADQDECPTVEPIFPITPGGPISTPDNSRAQCPVCNQWFPSRSVERHVQACLDSFDTGTGMEIQTQGLNPIGVWIESTTSSLESMLAKPKNITLADYAYMERAFVQKLNEVRSLRVLLDEQSQLATPLPMGMSPNSMMAADEAMARKCMEEMELEERKKTSTEEENFKALMELESTCCICKKVMQEQLNQLQCDHMMCSGCLAAHVLRAIEAEDYDCHIVCPAKHCCVNVEQREIKQVLSKEDFDRYLHRTFMSTVEADDSLIKCPKCAMIVEKLEATTPTGSGALEQVGMTGKKLSDEALYHCREHRFRCRQCDTVFCSSCSVTPYHIGFLCQEYRDYLEASKCRYCDDVVPLADFDQVELMAKPRARILALMEEKGVTLGEGHHAHSSKSELVAHFEKVERSVCMNDECRANTREGCMKTHDCGHPCFGVIGDVESGCLPCLHEDCQPVDGQTQEDFCNICWTEALRKQPCIQLKCNHIFHVDCLKMKIASGGSAARILFNQIECPLCKQHMDHPALAAELAPHRALFEKIKEKCLQRLKFEGLEKDPLLQPGGRFEGDQLGFAMKKFAYYSCYKCKEPYFGGHRACEDLQEENQNEHDPAELVCSSCAAGPGVMECPVHGKDFIEFKCKFCCTVSNWYCWGTTHFCDECHNKQGTPQAQTRKKKSDLNKCSGGPSCPLKIARHPPAGEEYVLGCAICRHTAPEF